MRPGRESSEFVTRPIARIQEPPESLFATSALNIADSMTKLVESAVGPSRSDMTPLLPARLQTRLLARPFEIEVIETLRGAGYTAGEVSAAGAWLTQDGIFVKPGAGRPSGQIDVLAWHPSGHTIVADCKVLQLPAEPESLRNTWSKIGPADAERFRAKLRRNARWCEAFGRSVDRLECAVILDRGFHFGQPDDDVIITDIELLRQNLA
jgi:hypothetical protein